MATFVNILKKQKSTNAILLTGLPGVGLVGKIAIDHLISQVKPEKVADVSSDSFPPSVITKNGIIELIKDEIFYSKVAGQDFYFLAGPVQPTLDFRSGSAQEHYEFAEKIVHAAKELGVKKIITLAGLSVGDRRLNSEPKIILAGTSKQFLEEFKKESDVTVDAGEGLISGAAGLILGIAKDLQIEGICLMGETNAQLVYGDHGAAKKVLELVCKKYKFKANLAELEKEAKKIEEAFTSLSKQLQEQEEEDENFKPTYVR